MKSRPKIEFLSFNSTTRQQTALFRKSNVQIKTCLSLIIGYLDICNFSFRLLKIDKYSQNLEIDIWTMGGSPGDVSENPVTQEKRKKG